MSRQYVYYDSKWRGVQRKWVYQSGKWVEVFYDHLLADAAWRVAFIQNPAHMATIRVAFKGVVAGAPIAYYGWANDPDPNIGQFGTLTTSPTLIAPTSPWRLTIAANLRYQPTGWDPEWTHIVRFRAPAGTPNPGKYALKSIGYKSFDGKNYGRGRTVFNFDDSTRFGYSSNDNGEAYAQYASIAKKYEGIDDDWLIANLPDMGTNTLGQDVPWGARFKV